MTPAHIKAIRLALKMSQTEFARTIGVSFAAINRWENGHNVPTQIAISRLKELSAKVFQDQKATAKPGDKMFSYMVKDSANSNTVADAVWFPVHGKLVCACYSDDFGSTPKGDDGILTLDCPKLEQVQELLSKTFETTFVYPIGA